MYLFLMKNVTYILCFACLTLSTWGCNQSEKEKEQEATPISKVTDLRQKAHPYIGFYRAELPAASGPGIRSVLQLNKDSNYRLTMTYLEEKDANFTEEGKYTKDGDLFTLHSDTNSAPRYFKLQGKNLVMLTSDKKEVEGSMRNNYIFRKR